MTNSFYERLIKEREEILDNLARAEESEKPVELDQQSVGRLSRMDALQNQSMAKAASARRRVRLILIDKALERLKAGEFGYCVDCGEDIAPRRLENDPTYSKCLDCAKGA